MGVVIPVSIGSDTQDIAFAKRTDVFYCPGLAMSRAEDFPAEILDRIVFYVATGGYHSTGEVTNKEGLGCCSLVCRHWAERTSPALFDTLFLRSKADLDILLGLVAR